MIKWGLQKGFISLPQSVRPERLKENFVGVFDWEIPKEMMDSLDTDFDEELVTGWDPTTWEDDE